MLVNNTGEKKLSILCYEDGLSFCVFLNDEIVHQEFISFKEQSLEDIFKSNLYIKQTYDIAYLAVLNKHFSIVPHKFYKLNSNIGWLNWDKQNSPSTWRSVNVELQSLDAEFVFAVEEDLLFLLQQYQPDIKVYHVGSLFCTEILRSVDKKSIFINYNHDWLEIAIVNKGFKMFNFYKTNSSEDFIYFTLNAMQQFGLNPDQDPLYYFGDIVKYDNAFTMLQKYVRRALPGNSNIDIVKNFIHFIQIQS